MKPRLLLPFVLLPLPLLMMQACDKPEEKPAVKVTPPPENPGPKNNTPDGTAVENPAAAAEKPAPPPARPAPVPPTQAEVDAFYSAVDAFVKEATPVVEAGTPLTDEVRNPLRMKMIELLRTRGKFVPGMTPAQRNELVQKLAPLTKLQQALLTPAAPLRPATPGAEAGRRTVPPADAPPSPETPAPPPVILFPIPFPVP